MGLFIPQLKPSNIGTKRNQGEYPRPLFFLGDYIILRTGGCLFSVGHNLSNGGKKKGGVIGSKLDKLNYLKKER